MLSNGMVVNRRLACYSVAIATTNVFQNLFEFKDEIDKISKFRFASSGISARAALDYPRSCTKPKEAFLTSLFV